MIVEVSGKLEIFVQKEIARGKYESADAVIQRALTLLQDCEQASTERIDELRRDIAMGIEQADRGLVAPFEPEKTLERIRQGVKNASEKPS